MINCSFTKQKARKIVVKGCSLHRQGISLSADAKTRIYFEKTCGTDLFCNSVPKLTHFCAGVLLFHEKALLRLKNGKVYDIVRYRQIGI